MNLAANVLLFGRMLRRAGLDIHHGRLLDAETVEETLGLLLKNQEDIQAVRGERIQAMLNRALARGAGS